MTQGSFRRSAPYSSIKNVTSSSIGDSVLSRFKLSSKDQRRLDDLYHQISMGLLEWRRKKIEKLEEFDQAMSQRAAVESQIKKLEGFQVKKIAAQRNRQEQLMLENLRKKEKYKKKLREESETYKKKFVNEEKEKMLGKSQVYVSLIRARVDIEFEIEKLEEEQRRLGLEYAGQSWSELENQVQSLRQSRESVEHQFTINVIEPKPQKPDFKSLTCNQIRTLIFNWSLQNQKQEIYSLLKKIRYSDQSFTEIESYILQEQAEKEALFEDLMKLKSKLQTMQAENQKIEFLLATQQNAQK